MKRFFLTMLMAAALITGVSVYAAQLKGASPKMHKAVVELTEQVKLMDVILKGEYLFVHDDERMAKGEDCTYIYTHDKGKQGRLVVSFHCEPVQREKAAQFTIITEWNGAVNMAELVEYRFAGDTEGHKVPKHAMKP